MKHQKNFKKSERGQSLVEMGISLIILLFLLTGGVDISLALFQYVTIRDAAQEGATYGSIMPGETQEIQWRTMDAASDIVDLAEENVEVIVNGDSCEGQTNNVPNSITVRTTFNHPITLPFVAGVLGTNTITLRAQVTNTILQPVCEGT